MYIFAESDMVLHCLQGNVYGITAITLCFWVGRSRKTACLHYLQSNSLDPGQTAPKRDDS